MQPITDGGGSHVGGVIDTPFVPVHSRSPNNLGRVTLRRSHASTALHPSVYPAFPCLFHFSRILRMNLYFELLIFLSGGRLYVSFVWHSVGRAVWQTRNWKAAGNGKVFRGTRISFHLLHCSDVSDAFILRRRICTNYKGLVIFSPSIALHLLFWFYFEKATAKKTPPMQRRENKMREKKSNRNQE
jgi:hypothetical protein